MKWYPLYFSAAAKSLQSCPTLCDPIDSSPSVSRSWDSPGKNTGVVAISFSSAWQWKVKVKSLSCVWLFETPWTVAYQAPPSMGFPRQEYWSGLPLPSPCTSLLTNNHVTFFFPHAYLSLIRNSWWNSYSNLFSIFLVGCLILLSCKSPLYNWDTSPNKSDSCFANIFSLAKCFIF